LSIVPSISWYVRPLHLYHHIHHASSNTCCPHLQALAHQANALQGHINPTAPPLTEKENVFHTSTNVSGDSGSPSMDREHDTKNPITYNGEAVDSDDDQSDLLQADPFVPFDDLPEERSRILTIRAVLLGCICGALVGSSNIYLGLKTGWTFGASLFGAIVGFAVLKPLAKALPETFPIFGGDFGMHNIVTRSMHGC
jgi:hypothetical protein